MSKQAYVVFQKLDEDHPMFMGLFFTEEAAEKYRESRDLRRLYYIVTYQETDEGNTIELY